MKTDVLALFEYGVQLVTLMASVGGIAYYLMAAAAARKLRKRRERETPVKASCPPMSLLKPVGGVHSGLEDHLESFFRQDYPSFEILFAVQEPSDPVVTVVERLVARHPHVPIRLIIAGESPYPNAKVFSMEKMAARARHETLVITDDDTSVGPGYLKALAHSFESTGVGAITNLYRGIAGSDFWSKLEALGMSTEFMAGVVVAERLEGMKFTLGPSMAVRAECLQAIGGFAALAEYLADDFVLGERVDQAGYQVLLSTHVVNHHASSIGFVNSFEHRLRWNRSSRFSRPAGYLGQGITYGLLWGCLFCAMAPNSWGLGVLVCALTARAWLALELGRELLEDRTVLRRLGLIPLQDLLSFVTWVGGFLGRDIVWRNQRYRLLEGGRFCRLSGIGEKSKMSSPLAPSGREGPG